MDYKRIYNEIIDNRKLNKFHGYTENHHIIPKSVGGLDIIENLVELTAREHFICHYLLTKMFEPKTKEFYSMVKAFSMMGCCLNEHRYINSRLYESNRKYMSETMSKLQIGTNNSQFGTCWINNGTDNKKIKKELLSEFLDNGWIKGRINVFTDEQKMIISVRSKNMEHKSRPQTEETKQKLSLANKGKKLSDEYKLKISKSLIGKNIGKTFPNRKKRDGVDFKIVTCPHCNKEGKSIGMTRWHFENCKLKI
ncbi:MAG: HNH endonuclease signature motif containing protein [Bacteroidales bacterium]|jgi:hypothetical protein